jgi:hypothetical protein
MKINRTRFWRIFALLTIIEACFLLSGCTAAWLNTVSGMLPSIAALANIILSFVSALEGKTVSADIVAAIQKWQQNIASLIASAQQIIADLKANMSTTLISQLQTVMQSIVTQFNSILTAVNIVDPATVAKFTQFLALGVAAVNAVLALIPMAISKLESHASEEELKHYDKLAADHTKLALSTMKETYVAIRAEHTVNVDVNTALDLLPAQL